MITIALRLSSIGLLTGLLAAGCSGGGDAAGRAQRAAAADPAESQALDYEVDAKRETGPYDRTGFVTFRDGDRLWVFARDSAELADYHAHGELAKHVTLIGVGPAGMTIQAPDRDTALEYLATRDGFVVDVESERLWVFREGSEELAQFRAGGEPAKHVTRVGVGPLDTTIQSPDSETLDSYLAAKPGFTTFCVDDRIWVFHDGSVELEEFETEGWLDRHVTLVGAGPGGMTVKAPDKKTIHDYVVTQPGFYTIVADDDRLWVFRLDSDALAQYYERGMPDKHITLVSKGPLGMTLKAPDRDTADAYLRVASLSN